MAVLKIAIGKSDRSVKQYYGYLTRKSKTKTNLVTALNCSTKTVPEEMLRTKNLFDKNKGRQFYDFIQTFDLEEELTPQHAHELGVELAKRAFGSTYEVAIVTHIDKGYLHNHIMINSVSFTTGKKFDNKRSVLYMLRKINEEILKREKLLTLSELKKQNRTGSKNSKATKHLSEKEIPDKTYILDCSNKVLKTSNNMSEYISRMSGYNITVVFTEKNTYFKYNNRTYGQSSLGKEVSLNELSKSFNKRSSHITLLKEAVMNAKESAINYDDFINNLKSNKNIVVNQRGQKTLSLTYGKRKPVRIEKLGYTINDLQSFFINKEEFNIFNNKFNEILLNNNNISYEQILNILKEKNIIICDSIYDKNFIINNKKISSENILREIHNYFSENNYSNENLIKNIYKYLNKSFSLDDLSNKYNISSLIINDEIIFTDKVGYYIIPKNKVKQIIDKNLKRKEIWKSLSTATSLPGFLAYNAADVREEKGVSKIYIDDIPIEELGIKNSWGKNTLSYENIINKINDNKYYNLNDKTTFRGKLREDIYIILNRSIDIKDFYFKLNKAYNTKLMGKDICIFNPELNIYFNIKELTGRNDDTNPLSFNKLTEYFNYKNRAANIQLDSLTYKIIKNLFSASAYRNNKNYNNFSEEYFKQRRKKDENKNRKTTV